jgi:flagellum-specific peptidoglycan hydrolase FlgJ
MIRKLLFFILGFLIFGCNATVPALYTAKTITRKPNTTIVRTNQKPVSKKMVAKKPIVTKTVVKKTSVKKNTVEQKSVVSNTVVATPESKSIENDTQNTEVLEATTRVKVTTEMVLAYIDQFKAIAKNNMTQYGIPSSIILAQGILESGAGTGSLSMTANNHFGIKCHKEWTGPSVRHDDDAAQECFRKYELPKESYQDHSLFLTSRPWYASLFDLQKDDYQAWAKGLKEAGYATDPEYPVKLIAIIERYQLNQYDAEVLGKKYTPIAVNENVVVSSGGYQVAKGDTLYSISKKFNLTVEELKSKNNISDNNLSLGQTLRVD